MGRFRRTTKFDFGKTANTSEMNAAINADAATSSARLRIGADGGTCRDFYRRVFTELVGLVKRPR